MRRAALACAILGALLLVPFHAWWTLALGVLLLLAAVVCGVLAIATPEFLRED